MIEQQIQLYTTGDGQIRLEVTQSGETLWLSQAQMAELFGTKRSAITKHLVSIFDSGELSEQTHVPFWNMWPSTAKNTKQNTTTSTP